MTDADGPRVLARLAELIEHRLAPALERIAAALERAPAAPTPPPETRAVMAAAIRRAIDVEAWPQAEERLRDLRRDHPEDAEAAEFAREIDSRRGASAEVLGQQIRAAHAANDPERMLELRDELVGLLEEGPRAELDRQVIGWLMALVQRRLRIAPMPPDVPWLAAAIAERFAATPEGASLRKALPTLRRSAGLCPRCARPYRGIADACPECLLAAATAEPQVIPMTPPEDGPPDEEGPEVAAEENPFAD